MLEILQFYVSGFWIWLGITYGKVFTTAEDTCMWVFATTEEEIEYMQQWELHE